MLRFIQFLGYSLLLSVTTTVWAASPTHPSPPASPPTKEKKDKVPKPPIDEADLPNTFTAIWLSQEAREEEIYIKNFKGNPILLNVGCTSRGSPFRVKKEPKTVFYRKIITPPQNPGENPTERYEPAGEIAWPETDAHAALFVLAFQPGPEGSFQIFGQGYNDDLQHFPRNSLRFINLSGLNLGVIIGSPEQDPSLLTSGQVVTIPYPTPSDLNANPVNTVFVQILDPEKKYDDERILIDGYFAEFFNSRRLFIIGPAALNTEDPQKPYVISIFDYPAPPKLPKGENSKHKDQ